MSAYIPRKFILLYILFGLIFGIVDFFVMSDLQGALYSIFMPLFLIVPPIAYKLFKIKPVESLSSAAYIYFFLSYGLGIAARLYQYTEWFDKFVHFLAGYSFAILGLIIFYLLKEAKTIDNKKDCWLPVWFSFSTSMMVGAVWELIEYADSIVLGTDPQRVLQTGIHDTMQDLAACFAGAVIASAAIYLYYHKGKKLPLIKTFEDFFKEIFQS